MQTEQRDPWFDRYDEARVVCNLLDDQIRVHYNLSLKASSNEERDKLKKESDEMWNARLKWFVLRDMANTAMKIRANPQKYDITNITEELNGRAQRLSAKFESTIKETEAVLQKHNIRYYTSFSRCVIHL